MIRLYGDKLGIWPQSTSKKLVAVPGECPPGYGCGGQVWETWWTEYHLDNLLYTLYTADQGAFAVDHRKEHPNYYQKLISIICIPLYYLRAAGYHHDVSPGR